MEFVKEENKTIDCKCKLNKIYARGKLFCISFDKEKIKEILNNNEPYCLILEEPRLINSTNWINSLGKLIVDLQTNKSTKQNPNSKFISYLKNEIETIKNQPTYKNQEITKEKNIKIQSKNQYRYKSNCSCNLNKVYARGKMLCISCDKNEIEELVQNNEPYFIIEIEPRLIDANEWVNNLCKSLVDYQTSGIVSDDSETIISYLKIQIKNIEMQPTYPTHTT